MGWERISFPTFFTEKIRYREGVLGMSVDLSVDFCGIKLENPFILAPSPSTDHLDLLIEAFDAGWGRGCIKDGRGKVLFKSYAWV
jgi:hypothetical protein